MALRFVWDDRKDTLNRRKHQVGFPEAISVFSDPLALVFDDPQHSAGERREIIIGHSSKPRLLLVVFTERQGDTLRIISARPATSRERHDYEENRAS